MMKSLNPTLWRTCRVLSGNVRLLLLREIVRHPGQNVSQLAEELQIGISDASQELRRLQSRGLLRRSVQGRSVVYWPIPDPQVPSAAPLLKCLQTVLSASGVDTEAMARTAKALAHEQRVAIASALLPAPQPARRLTTVLKLPPMNFRWHLKTLRDGGLVEKSGRKYHLSSAPTPLAAVLIRLLAARS